MCRILEYVFSISSENILLKKNIEFGSESGLATSSSMIVGDLEDLTRFSSHCIVVSKRIFRLKYSSTRIFRFISHLSWIIGLDCPILISTEIIRKMGNSEEIDEENEDIVLVNTLSSLASYNPIKYSVIPIQDDSLSSEVEILLPNVLVSPMDQRISDVQLEIFNRRSECW